LERRLAAILAADVVGYSRLMAADETATLVQLRALRKECIEPKVAEHRGRIAKLMGDGALVEFASVVDAVECAAAVQRAVSEHQAAVPERQRIAFRIGINLCDAIIEDGDIYGSGVNVAARLEALAEPGGIWITRTVYDHVRDKVGFAFQAVGEHKIKNIPEPVTAYRVITNASRPGALLLRGRRPPARWLWTAAGLGALAAAMALVLWLEPWSATGPVPIEADALPMPDKPSIAVLPFDDLNDDPEEAYFADGLTDDLITDLSAISGLFVIARNSVFAYADEPVDVRRVAKELGVRYVLEGTVRRAGGRVRINAQLIDGTTGSHVWAERYDRDYADIFVLQDEVIERIVEALSVQLTDTERTQVERLPTDDLKAYDYYLRAEQKVYDAQEASLAEALDLYEQALELDPKFTDAYAGYARAVVDVFSFDYAALLPGAVAREEAYDAAGRALGLNPDTPRAYSVLALLQMLDGEHDEAIDSAQKAVALDPNSADAHLNQAIVLTYAGRPSEAMAAMETALRLNPKPPAYVHGYHGFVLYMNHRYEQSVEALEKVEASVQSDFGLETLAMAYARLGRRKEAKAAIERLLERWSNQSLAFVRVAYAHHRRKEDLAQRLDALRDAGLPAWPYGFQGSAEDRLDGDAVQTLTFGRSWSGHLEDGRPFMQQVSANGDAVQRVAGGLIVGTASISGDLLCMQSPATLLGRRHCGPVYRNPGGTARDQNEYVHPNADTVRYFSLAP
jgi:adenylate cyclase